MLKINLCNNKKTMLTVVQMWMPLMLFTLIYLGIWI